MTMTFYLGQGAVLTEYGYPDERFLVDVVKLTATQVTVLDRGKERRFALRTGKEIGTADLWRCNSVTPITDELARDVLEERRRRDFIQTIVRATQSLEKKTTEQLRRLVAALEP